MAGRSTPTLTFTATGTASDGVGGSNATRSVVGAATLLESTDSSKAPASYDQMLLGAERRHNKLLDELASLEEGIGTIALQLRHDG